MLPPSRYVGLRETTEREAVGKVFESPRARTPQSTVYEGTLPVLYVARSRNQTRRFQFYSPTSANFSAMDCI